MSGRVNRHAYEGMIAENLEWLRAQPRTLEREHIETILARSAEYEYGDGYGAARAHVEALAAKDEAIAVERAKVAALREAALRLGGTRCMHTTGCASHADSRTPCSCYIVDVDALLILARGHEAVTVGPSHKATIIARLGAAWERDEHQRLGQLISDAIIQHTNADDVFSVGDVDLVEACEQMVRDQEQSNPR